MIQAATNPLSEIPTDTQDRGTREFAQPEDTGIQAAVVAWSKLSPAERDAASRAITLGQRSTLIGYGERMATLAVRQHREDLIFVGLLALGVDGWRFDCRDNLVRVALQYDAAGRLGLDPEKIFERAAAILPADPAAALRQFPRREPADRSLKAMGWKVAGEDQDFRYVSAPFEPLSPADLTRLRDKFVRVGPAAEAGPYGHRGSEPPESGPIWMTLRVAAAVWVVASAVWWWLSSRR